MDAYRTDGRAHTTTEYNSVSCEFKYVHYHFTSIECSIISLFGWHLLWLLLYRVYCFKSAIPLNNSKPQTISFSLTQSKARGKSKSRAKTLIRVDVELYNVHVLLNRLVVHSHFFSSKERQALTFKQCGEHNFEFMFGVTSKTKTPHFILICVRFFSFVLLLCRRMNVARAHTQP